MPTREDVGIVKAPVANPADFAALDPFFRIIEKGLDGLVEPGHFFDLLATNMQHWIFAFGQLPFEGGLLAVNIEALSVLAGGIEEEPSHFKTEVLVANLEVGALE